MRADRLLSILLLLQPGRRLTARELAKRLEVSERTILRDMDALCAAGVPVVADRGAGGGWSLTSQYRTDLTGLNPAEIQSLFFAKSSRLLRDLGLDKAAEGALIKLIASLPYASRHAVDLTRERLHIDGAGWYQSLETFPFLSMAQQAAWEEKRLAIVYQRGDDTISQRVVDPLGLVAKGSVWYLVAAQEEDLRSFRISRIQEAGITDQPFTRPAGFDLAGFWEQSVVLFKANVPKYPARLKITRPALARLRRGRFVRVEGEEDFGDGWVEARVMFEVEEEAVGYILLARDQAIVVEPQSLRDRVRAAAESIAALYHNEQAASGEAASD